MDEKQTKQETAKRILERGVRIMVQAPFFLRLCGVKTIPLRIRPTRLGTQLYIAEKLLTIEADWDKLAAGDIDESHKLITRYGKLIAKVAAIAVLDSWWAIPVFSGMLGNYIRWHIQLKQLTELLLIIQMLNSPADFTTTIRLLRTATTAALDPKNQSPENQGS